MKGLKTCSAAMLVIATILIPAFVAGQPIQTLAIFPFENNSVTDPERYAPLSNGLAAMLITDLKNAGTQLKLVERDKIKAVLQEIALGQSGAVDQATAIQAGKILGAQTIAFGNFMVLEDQVRMDVRVIYVETSEMILGDYVMGDSDEFFKLERQLAKKIAGSMNVAFVPTEITTPVERNDTVPAEVPSTPREDVVIQNEQPPEPVTVAAKPEAESAGNSDIDAALYFSKGLDALDRGDMAEADQMFEACIKRDPAYKAQVDNAKGLL